MQDAPPLPSVTTLPPGDSITVDLLCGDWHICQLRKGHRFSTDDVVCAWIASQTAPEARRLLDLGAGAGSVGLMTLFAVNPDATLTMVEAQEISHQLAKRTIAMNGLGPRVQARHGDLRDPLSVPEDEHGTYDLVTGSPPYFPVGTAVQSPHPQRAACRMELRGDVFGYAETAAKALSPTGRFALVHSGVDPRPEQAILAAGLHIHVRQDVYFRANKATPTVAIWIAGHQPLPRVDRPRLVVRQDDGAWTPEYLQVRRDLGAPEPRR